VVYSEWLVILRTFVHFLLESNLQTFYKYANKYLELTSEKQRSQICYETDVQVDHRCVFWGFPSVIRKFRLSDLKRVLLVKCD